MLTRRVLFAAALLVTAASPLAAQTTPPKGSPLRAELMDAFRPTVEAEIGGPIEFVVIDLRVMGPWAYARVRPQRPGGRAIDWNRTKFREDMKQGYMSDLSLALLRRSGSGWRVVEYAIGPSDAPWDGWDKTHGVSRRLFTDD
jgi:hypothetical protein